MDDPGVFQFDQDDDLAAFEDVFYSELLPSDSSPPPSGSSRVLSPVPGKRRRKGGLLASLARSIMDLASEQKLSSRSSESSLDVASRKYASVFSCCTNALFEKGRDSVTLLEKSKKSSVCGTIWKNGNMAYRCRDCQVTVNSCICVECFRAGDHEGHDYLLYASACGGCCDCGDPDAWKPSGFCSNHVGASSSVRHLATSPAFSTMAAGTRYSPASSPAFKSVPQPGSPLLSVEAEKVVRLMIEMLALFLDAVLSKRTSSIYYNEIMIDKIARWCREVCSLGDALRRMVCEATAVVTIHPGAVFDHLGDDEFDAEADAGKHSQVSAVMKDSMEWTGETKEGSGGKGEMDRSRNEEALYESISRGGEGKEVAIIDLLLKGCVMLDRAADGMSSYMLDMLYDPVFKVVYAKHYVKHYESVLEVILSKKRSKAADSILSTIGAQLFNFMDLVVLLVKEEGFVSKLLEKLTLFFYGNSLSDESGNLTLNCDKDTVRNDLYGRFLNEFNTVMSYTQVSEYMLYENKALFQGLLTCMACLHGMNPNVRVMLEHVEYEPDTWKYSFNIEQRMNAVIPALTEGFGMGLAEMGEKKKREARDDGDEEMVDAVIDEEDEPVKPNVSGTTLTSTSQSHSATAVCPEKAVSVLQTMVSELKGIRAREANLHFETIYIPQRKQSVSYTRYNIGLHGVSFHIPIHRLFYSCVHEVAKRDVAGVELRDVLRVDRDSALLLFEHPLRIRALMAQVQAGMWRRNGEMTMLGQLHMYQHPYYTSDTLAYDTLALQTAAILLDSPTYLLTLLERFRLSKWLSVDSANHEEEEDAAAMLTLAERFLHLMMTVVVNRARIGKQDALRTHIIQWLCVGPQNYSKLVNQLSYDSQLTCSKEIEQILAEVATRRTVVDMSGRRDNSGYRLKPEYWAEFDPTFLFYEQKHLQIAFENYVEYVKLAKTEETSTLPLRDLEMIKPFYAFRDIFRVIHCEIFHKILFVILYNAHEKTDRYSGKLLDITYYMLMVLAQMDAPESAKVESECSFKSAEEEEESCVEFPFLAEIKMKSGWDFMENIMCKVETMSGDHSMLSLLCALSRRDDLSNRKNTMGKILSMISARSERAKKEISEMLGEDDGDAKLEKERDALRRKAAVMAKFSAMQKEFNTAIMDISDSDSEEDEEGGSGLCNGQDGGGEKGLCSASGSLRSSSKRDTFDGFETAKCELCKDESSVLWHNRPLGLVGMLSRSCILASMSRRAGCELMRADLSAAGKEAASGKGKERLTVTGVRDVLVDPPSELYMMEGKKLLDSFSRPSTNLLTSGLFRNTGDDGRSALSFLLSYLHRQQELQGALVREEETEDAEEMDTHADYHNGGSGASGAGREGRDGDGDGESSSGERINSYSGVSISTPPSRPSSLGWVSGLHTAGNEGISPGFGSPGASPSSGLPSLFPSRLFSAARGVADSQPSPAASSSSSSSSSSVHQQSPSSSSKFPHQGGNPCDRQEWADDQNPHLSKATRSLLSRRVEEEQGMNLSSCGHLIHFDCLDRYLKARGQGSFTQEDMLMDNKAKEFWCPICRRLCNVLLPLSPDSLSVRQLAEKGDAAKKRESLLLQDEKSTLLGGWLRDSVRHMRSLLESISEEEHRARLDRGNATDSGDDDDDENTVERPPGEVLDRLFRSFFKRAAYVQHRSSFLSESSSRYAAYLLNVLVYSLCSAELNARSTWPPGSSPVFYLEAIPAVQLTALREMCRSLFSLLQNAFPAIPRAKKTTPKVFLDAVMMITTGYTLVSEPQVQAKGRGKQRKSAPATTLGELAPYPLLCVDSFALLVRLVLFSLPGPLFPTSFFLQVRVCYHVSVIQAILYLLLRKRPNAKSFDSFSFGPPSPLFPYSSPTTTPASSSTLFQSSHSSRPRGGGREGVEGVGGKEDVDMFSAEDHLPPLYESLSEYFSIEQKTASPRDSKAEIVSKIQALCLPFLRRTLLFYVKCIAVVCSRHPAPVDFPNVSIASQFETIANYFNLPSVSKILDFQLPQDIDSHAVDIRRRTSNFQYSDIGTDQEVMLSLISVWISQYGKNLKSGEFKVLSSTPCVSPYAEFSLIPLPHLFQDLFHQYVDVKCDECQTVPDNPAICLLCGEYLCLNSACCRPLNNGEGFRHTMTCGAGTGVFLILRKSGVVIIRDGKWNDWGSPYLDAHGEEDMFLERGRPLYLDDPSLQSLCHIVSSHTMDDTILRPPDEASFKRPRSSRAL